MSAGGPTCLDVPLGLLGGHVARRADRPGRTGCRPESASRSLARPKSVILGTPSAVKQDVARLEVAVDEPAWWAACTARASVSTSSAASRGGMRLPGQPLRRGCRRRRIRARDRGRPSCSPTSWICDDVRVLQPGDGLRPRTGTGRAAPASACRPARIILSATMRFELQVAGLVDDAHAAAAQDREDLVDRRWSRSARFGIARAGSIHPGA